MTLFVSPKPDCSTIHFRWWKIRTTCPTVPPRHMSELCKHTYRRRLCVFRRSLFFCLATIFLLGCVSVYFSAWRALPRCVCLCVCPLSLSMHDDIQYFSRTGNLGVCAEGLAFLFLVCPCRVVLSLLFLSTSATTGPSF
jgi:hypothetical protein